MKSDYTGTFINNSKNSIIEKAKFIQYAMSVLRQLTTFRVYRIGEVCLAKLAFWLATYSKWYQSAIGYLLRLCFLTVSQKVKGIRWK